MTDFRSAIHREIGDRAGEATTLSNASASLFAMRRLDEALEYLESALLIVRELGDRGAEGSLRHNIALVLAELGRNDEAVEHQKVAGELAETTNNPSLPFFAENLEQPNTNRAN